MAWKGKEKKPADEESPKPETAKEEPTTTMSPEKRAAMIRAGLLPAEETTTKD